MKKSLAAAAILTLVCGFALAADSGTLSGTFTNSAVDDGTNAYLKLVSDGDCMAPDPGEHSAMATFAEGKASYSIEGVANGPYTACAFIDANAKEGQVTADSGDYATMLPVTVEGDTTLDIDEASWMQIP